MYSKVKGYNDNFTDYFPEYEESYTTPRKYFWNIFSTLNKEQTEKFIDHLIKEETSKKLPKNVR